MGSFAGCGAIKSATSIVIRNRRIITPQDAR